MTQAQEQSSAKNGSSNLLATRMTAVLAVLAALSSGRWGASNLQAILEQGKVNDAWSFYQAKSVKRHGLEQTRDLLHALGEGESGARGEAFRKLESSMNDNAKREAEEGTKIMEDAKNFNIRRNRLVENSFWLEISFACLQLGVILCTIAAGTKFRLGLPAGVALGALGVLLFINGLHTFVHAPASWYQGTGQAMGYDPSRNAAK